MSSAEDVELHRMDGEVTLKEKAPDSITTWVTTAFAISKKKGIGFTPAPVELTVFKTCFADLRLPFSVIRYEELELRVVLFNYHSSKQTITVTLKASADNAFYARGTNEVSPTTVQEVVLVVKVPAGDGKEVTFTIKPVKLGDIPVEVHIGSDLCSDALRKDLNVEAEGEPGEYNKAILFQVDDEEQVEEVEVDFPDNVVADSQRIQVTALGDIMGPSLQNLDDLIKQPYGCGEQNMLNFAPNIYAMDYFLATGTGSLDKKASATKNMNLGYQKELTFMHRDGSYSAFTSDPSGSSWLTAFVLRCFNQATRHIKIDLSVISKGVDFLLKHQKSDGSFDEPGRVLHSAMQGRAAGGLPLTAYIAKVLTELRPALDKRQAEDVSRAISKVQGYLEGELKNIKTNVYALALTCYFLCEVESNKAEKCLDDFEALSTREGGFMYWDLQPEPEEKGDDWRPPYTAAYSNNVEATAYGLLTFLLKDDTVKGALISKWLSAQRSGKGGFRTTQDTVIGIQALSVFASKVLIMDGAEVDVKIEWNRKSFNFDTIVNSNADILQQKELSNPGQVKKVKITVKGTGPALVQVNVYFNIEKSSVPTGYELTVDSTQEDEDNVKIKACVRYTLPESGMSVVEMFMLSGYEPKSLADVVEKYGGIGLRKAELDGKRVALYFDGFNAKQECVELMSKRTFTVDKLQPAFAQVYSYYKTDNRATALYRPVSEVDPPQPGSSSAPTVDPEVGNIRDSASAGPPMPALVALVLSLSLALCLKI